MNNEQSLKLKFQKSLPEIMRKFNKLKDQDRKEAICNLIMNCNRDGLSKDYIIEVLSKVLKINLLECYNI